MKRLRAPEQDGAVVAEPPLDAVGVLVETNRRRLAGGELFGRPLADLRAEARASALNAATSYLREAGEPIPASLSASLFLAGHQPELFHPGVWAKNFALNRLGRLHTATPVNLVVDNDALKQTSLRFPSLPTRSDEWPHMAKVPFDHGPEEKPYEERRVHDEALFADFPERAQEVHRDWSFTPILGDFWKEARRQAHRTPLLGERFAAARRTFERRWGCHNLELPVSRLCATETYAWFACHVFADLPRFHALHNQCVQEYRVAYRIRSRNHPVPDLARDGDWFEAPFWAWRTGQGRRGRLFVRRAEARLELRVDKEDWPSLPISVGPAVQTWTRWERDGYHMRSRALTNTLYARLFLADVFIHGIGGGKYDELTDAICRRYLSFEPPGYMVLSATLLLPFAGYPVTEDDCRRLHRLHRELQFTPERHVDEAARSEPEVRDLLRLKQELIAQNPERAEQRRQRFRSIRLLNTRLGSYLGERERSAEREEEKCRQQLQANAVLRRRDYAFCLYPAEMLEKFCRRFLA